MEKIKRMHLKFKMRNARKQIRFKNNYEEREKGGRESIN